MAVCCTHAHRRVCPCTILDFLHSPTQEDEAPDVWLRLTKDVDWLFNASSVIWRPLLSSAQTNG